MRMDDETLMAFADGELTGEQAGAVARAVAADPALAARVDLFRKTRAALAMPDPAADAFAAGGSAADDRDAALIAQIRAAQAASAVVPATVAVPNAPRPAPANRNRAPAAVAASLVVALGLGWWSGMFTPTPTQLPAGGLSPALVAALDSVPSAQSRDGFTAIATYQTADGRLCREYETTAPPQIAIACHEKGGWVQRFAAAEITDTGAYVPATGDLEALDAALADLRAGEPLPPEDEARALATLPRPPA